VWVWVEQVFDDGEESEPVVDLFKGLVGQRDALAGSEGDGRHNLIDVHVLLGRLGYITIDLKESHTRVVRVQVHMNSVLVRYVQYVDINT
jgi:hypothetical protein